MIERIRKLLARCSDDERRQVFHGLKREICPHAFERRMRANAGLILDALDRGGDLSVRGIRGLIAEASFVLETLPSLTGWRSMELAGDLPYDALLSDRLSKVRVQVKLQRREKGKAWIRNDEAVVEVQRTRGGTRHGEDTRPYRFGEFDILAVCMEPSHERWNSFHYIPERWLLPRAEDPTLIKIMQPVALIPNAIWTNDFNEAVRRFRGRRKRPGN